MKSAVLVMVLGGVEEFRSREGSTVWSNQVTLAILSMHLGRSDLPAMPGVNAATCARMNRENPHSGPMPLGPIPLVACSVRSGGSYRDVKFSDLLT